MPNPPNQPSNPGGGSAPALDGPQPAAPGNLLALFGNPQQAEQAAPQPAAPAPSAPQAPAPAPSAPSAPQPQAPAVAPAEDNTEDIEPDLDPDEATHTTVVNSYKTALKKANREAANLRTRVKDLEAANTQLTTANEALKAQVVPTQRELTFFRTIHEDGSGIGSVLYPQLLWQALSTHLEWDANNVPTNLQEALGKARAQFPALFKPVPSANGGEGVNSGGEGGFSMNNFIRGGMGRR